MIPTLRFYRYLERVRWLRSYRNKFLFVAFVATHIPLLAVIVYLTQAQGSVTASTVFWIVLAATLAGTFGLLWILRQLLQPVLLAAQALNRYLANGEIMPLPANLQDEAGVLLRDVGVAIRAFSENQQRLEQHATTDFLTGLPNRRGADERLRKSFPTASDSKGPVYVAMLDIDHFKRLNDGYGHGVGDLALRNVGLYLQQALGEEEGWAARWGGEEFLLILHGRASGTESTEDVRESLERLRQNIPAVPLGKGGTHSLTASIGLTEAYPGEPAELVLGRADVALYIAKQNGRNQTCFMDLQRKKVVPESESLRLSSGHDYERRRGRWAGSEAA